MGYHISVIWIGFIDLYRGDIITKHGKSKDTPVSTVNRGTKRK